MRKNKPSNSLRQVIDEIMADTLQEGHNDKNFQRITEAQYVFACSLFDRILFMVSNGENVRVKNFGTFSPRTAPESARNPKTNQIVPVSCRRRLNFKPSTSTVESINKPNGDENK